MRREFLGFTGCRPEGFADFALDDVTLKDGERTAAGERDLQGLAQDPQDWRRFDAEGVRRWFFKTTP